MLCRWVPGFASLHKGLKDEEKKTSIYRTKAIGQACRPSTPPHPQYDLIFALYSQKVVLQESMAVIHELILWYPDP